MDNWRTVYLEKDEEINNIINKLKGCSEEKIALIPHEQSKVLQQENNLKLLKLYLKQFDKEIVVVVSNQIMRNLLEKVGISVVTTLDELAVSSEREEEIKLSALQKAPLFWVPQRKTLGLLAFFLIGLLVACLVYYNLPWTVVEIIPATKQIEQTVEFTLHANSEEMNLDKKIIPAQEKRATFQLTSEFPATGVKIIGKTKAHGTVLLINENRQAIFLPARTVLSTLSGVKFITVQDVTIPKRRVEMFMGVPVGLTAGKVETTIEAQTAGTSGNVGSGEITSLLGYNLRVINAQATVGGEDQKLSIVTAQDLQKANQLMREKMLEAARKQLTAKNSKEQMILTNSLCIKNYKIGYNSKIDQEVENFTAQAKMQASILLVQQTTVQKASNYWLKKCLDSRYKLRNQEAQIISYQEIMLSEKDYKLAVLIAGQAKAQLDEQAIKQLVKGKSLKEAEKQLTALNEIGYFHIKGRKSQILPNSVFLIKIKIKDPRNE